MQRRYTGGSRRWSRSGRPWSGRGRIRCGEGDQSGELGGANVGGLSAESENLLQERVHIDLIATLCPSRRRVRFGDVAQLRHRGSLRCSTVRTSCGGFSRARTPATASIRSWCERDCAFRSRARRRSRPLAAVTTSRARCTGRPRLQLRLSRLDPLHPLLLCHHERSVLGLLRCGQPRTATGLTRVRDGTGQRGGGETSTGGTEWSGDAG